MSAMKTIKKTLGTGISVLLLLLFSATVLPLDSFHSHSTVEQSCAEEKDSCEHTVHIAKEASYCWICAIHYEKVFTSADAGETTLNLPVVNLLCNNAVTGYVAQILYTALRGPPSE